MYYGSLKIGDYVSYVNEEDAVRTGVVDHIGQIPGDDRWIVGLRDLHDSFAYYVRWASEFEE